ncbi:hypothetical protein HYALB_00009610 [Hymenoscyphus albidus]|uniref:Uncharacterized protein n=1 Tax=Hymenoscyphus albidus TaxID=595503 RepID=A0A9N9LV46_9HELO|nr:hypothetical protein HYALB_00009610 [Hymenoscyphus albidus]
MEGVEDILSAQVLSATATLQVYKDSLAPPPSTKRAWERAPRSASAPRLQGQKIWKRPGLRSHDNKENDETAIQAELEKRGTGSRKKRRIQGAKENISEAKWSNKSTQSSDLENSNGTKESARILMAFNEPKRGLMVPRKRTNANHLVTPRKAMKKRASHVSNAIVQSPTKVSRHSPEKPVRRRASMRRSLRRLTVTPEDVDVQAAGTFTFESPSDATRDLVKSAKSPKFLQEAITTPSKYKPQGASMEGQVLVSTTTSDVEMEQETELEISEEEQIAEQLYATSPMKRSVSILEGISMSADNQSPPAVLEDHVHVPIGNSEEQITPLSKTSGTPTAKRSCERSATRRSTRSTRSSLFTINQDTLLIEQLPEAIAEAPLAATPENRIKVSVREVMPTPQPNLNTNSTQTLLTTNEESGDIILANDSPSIFTSTSEVPSLDDREMIWSGVPDVESGARAEDKITEDNDDGDSHLEELEAFEATMVFNREGSEESSNFEDYESELEQSISSSICDEDSTQDLRDSIEPEDAVHTPTKGTNSPSSDPDDTAVESLEFLEPIPVPLDGSSSNAGEDENFDTTMEDVPDDMNAPLEDGNAQEQRVTNYDHDDTTVLLDFLSRHANKTAKTEVLVPERKRSLPHSPLKLPMSELEEPTGLSLETEPNDEFDVSVASEKPSKRKRRNSRSQNDEDLTEPATSIRRSGRTRLPVKSSQPAPSSIPFRRLGSDNTVTLQQNKEKELAAITRFNTRKNKGNALYPLDVLATQTEKGDIPSRHRALKELFDEKVQKQLKGKKAKSVVWAEQLTHYSTEKKIEDEKEADKEKGKTKEKPIIKKKVEISKEVVLERESAISAAEEKPPVIEGTRPEEKKLEEKKSSIPRVSMRSKMALGMAVNGTPAPKRRMKRA